jgi:hypothetical protein
MNAKQTRQRQTLQVGKTIKKKKNAREFAIEMSFVSVGSSHIRRLPTPRIEAASLFCSFKDTMLSENGQPPLLVPLPSKKAEQRQETKET